MRPWLGFIPTRPLNPAGMRVDPPPSLAVPHGMSPAATAAAVPPDDPPGVRLGSHGLRVTPHARVLVKLRVPNSGAAVLDRKSTRLNLQSLMRSSYAVFCLKKKKKYNTQK